MQMLREGREIAEIRTYIDAEYSQYGPPTDTEPVKEGHQSSCSQQTTEMCGGDLGGESVSIETTTWSQVTVPEAASD
jgi:hypothetical protein